jgi:5'-methylthioadenosine phosphorylase
MKIGVIGGTGLDNPEILEDYKEINVAETPFGKPSSPIITGKIKGIEVFIISRHGRKHEFPPTQVNNRANIFALKDKGCKFIIATTACGSLREEIKRGDFVVLDQFIDFTKQRKLTFFEKFEFGAIHTAMPNPFSEKLRKKLIDACKETKSYFHEKGTVITIEGSRFSTTAESRMFRQWGADVINMSIAPECILANEAEIPYAAIALSTDYDSWKQGEEPVSWDAVLKTFKENVEKMKQILIKTIESFSYDAECEEIKRKIRTIPDFPKQGVMFRDITTLLKDKDGFRKVIDILYNRYRDYEIDVVAGIESRGFIIGGILAEKLNCGFVPLRKKGKLPAETEKQDYMLEYGIDTIEVHKDAISPGQRVLVVDDLLATGGTAQAACNLVEKLGGRVVECTFVMELPELKGKEKLLGWKVFSIVEFEGG